MKKIYLLSMLLALFVTTGVSCKKSDNSTAAVPGSVCAECIEKHSGYHANKFCSTPDEVNLYVKELKKDGASAGQDWECTIK